MEDRIYNIVVKKDEVTWQTVIYDLIKSEELDPWNVNISRLSKRYLDEVKNLKEHNFFVSGKMILAAAILLRLKSDKLMNHHIAEFDTMLYPPEEELLEEIEGDYKHALMNQNPPKLLVKTPQARRKQITLNELMKSLEKALEVDERRRIKRLYELPLIEEAVMPKNVYNISDMIRSVYEKIVYMFKKKETLRFTDLLESDTKEDKVMTFIPLLHLCNQQKVDLHQDKPFGEISVTLMD